MLVQMCACADVHMCVGMCACVRQCACVCMCLELYLVRITWLCQSHLVHVCVCVLEFQSTGGAAPATHHRQAACALVHVHDYAHFCVCVHMQACMSV